MYEGAISHSHPAFSAGIQRIFNPPKYGKVERMQKQGSAKALFMQAYRRSPWNVKSTSVGPYWPTIDRFLNERRISYLEYALVHRLLRDFPDAAEEAALFLCHLILAAKEGHLCVAIDEKRIKPLPERVWQGEEPIPLNSDEIDRLNESILLGAENLPFELISSSRKDPFDLPDAPVFRDKNRFYLQKFWSFETDFLNGLFDFFSSDPSPSICPIALENALSELRANRVLSKEQAEAVGSGCLNSLTLINGGPGTGKTYTAGRLIKAFWDRLDSADKAVCQIVLAAPTGKAAANLQKSLSALTDSGSDFPPIRAKTLHSLLEINHRNPAESRVRLTADLLVVDESSMIDIRLAGLLLESLKPGSRLILLGDEHQLPSVEAGSVFADLVRAAREHPVSGISCITLSACLRIELQSSVDFARLIKSGKSDEALARLNDGSSPGIRRLTLPSNTRKAQHAFIDHALKYFPGAVPCCNEFDAVLKMFQAFRILSPLRKGPFGVEETNRLIWNKICQSLPPEGFLGVPIMISANDYRQELFNGETGVAIRKLPLQSLHSDDYALFPCRDSLSGVRKIPMSLLPRHEYAYCLSVHKSQGSEFDRILLALPEGSEAFGREVLYTGLTRARKHVDIYGSDAVLSATIREKNERFSGICERFADGSESRV